jgi:hypothetical protein
MNDGGRSFLPEREKVKIFNAEIAEAKIAESAEGKAAGPSTVPYFNITGKTWS